MPVTSVQKIAMEEVMASILTAVGGRRRQLAGMFMELVDREEWPQYYELIPEPRCLNNIKAGIEKGRYKDATDVYTDLSLVFWNAIFYNEAGSQIATDAQALKTLLEVEWKKKSVLPLPRTSPPPSSAQKVHQESTDSKKSINILVPPPTSSRVLTPVPPVVHTPVPTYTYTKTAQTRLNQALTMHDADVDISGMSPEPDDEKMLADGESFARETETEEIIKHLEDGLPRWPGYTTAGWMDEAVQDRVSDIIHTIKSYKDIIGNRLAIALESVPEESSLPFLSYTYPQSFKLIENRVRSKFYTTARDVDVSVMQLFEKARRWHDLGSESYGRVLLLQRLYQALTAAEPIAGPPFSSSFGFSSFSFVPGSLPIARSPNDSAITRFTFPQLVEGKSLVEELHYKGWSLRSGDWIHLSNPDDSSRPIIAQIISCWTCAYINSQKQLSGISANWYYRPEQTLHPATKKFWDGEVFKTRHDVDHPIDDVIEKIACQFTSDYVRGRPRAPFWYPGFPLYLCDTLYEDQDRSFTKITTWEAANIPIYPFERTILPQRVLSPFLRGVKSAAKGPGGILDGVERFDADRQDTSMNGRKRPRRGEAGLTKPQPTPTQTSYLPSVTPAVHKAGTADRSVISAAGGLAAVGGNSHVERLPTQTTKFFDRYPETGEVLWFSAAPINIAHPPTAKHSMTYLHYLARRRKEELGSADAMDEETGEAPTKRTRTQYRPTVTETLREIFSTPSN